MTGHNSRGDYATRLKAHLAEYKRDVLGVAENGKWVQNRVAYPHILPAEQRWLNVLEPIREDFQAFRRERQPELKLHRDFHHLNSSQAMAFNLFFPWFGFGHADVLLRALGVAAAPINEWKFEHIPDPEEFTNLDFWVRFADAHELHMEVKLTESHFASAALNEKYRAKLRSTYRPRLRGKIAPSVTDAALLEHYQLMRLVSGLTLRTGDEAIVIAPGAHDSLQREFNTFVELLEPECRARVRMVSLDRALCDTLNAASAGCEQASEVMPLFAEKYLI